VLYERGDDESGARFVEGWIPDYPREAALHCHLSWHRALFELGRGRQAFLETACKEQEQQR